MSGLSNSGPRNTNLHRRLLIRPGGIGDCIVTLPAMDALSCGETTVWITSSLLSVFLAHPLYAKSRCVVAAGLFLFGCQPNSQLPEPCRTLSQFDSIFSWYTPDPGSNERAAMLEAAPRIQFLTPIPAPDSVHHATDFHLQQVAPYLSGAPPDPVPGLPITAKRRRFVTFQPFASSPSKEWPLANFLALEAILAPYIPVHWIIPPERLPLSIQPAGPVLSESNLHEVAKHLAAATLFVGNDSGLSHLAAAVGTASVVLFGETNPQVWCPRGRNQVVPLQSTSGGLYSLTPESVFQAVHSLINSPKPA